MIKSFFRLSLFIGFIALVVTACKTNSAKDFSINSEFQKYIYSYTSGVISSASPITITFNDAHNEKGSFNEPIEENYFKISPSLKGKTVWLDAYTIQFIPEEKMKSGQEYWVEFNLGKLTNVERELKTFKFPFKTIKQAINFEVEGLRSYSNEFAEWYQFLGTAYTADVIDMADLDKNIDVLVNGKKKSGKWEKVGNNNLYNLVLDSVKRTDKSGKITIKWNSLQEGSSRKQETTQAIPSLSEFTVLSSKVVQHPEQYVLIRFSDPLLANQDLDGIVEIDGEYSVKTAVSTNELKIYPNQRLFGHKTVIIRPTIKNSRGFDFVKQEKITLNFEAIKPNVRLVGKGTILPSSNNMMFAFEAVNLKAVDIRIIKVFENNVHQFFQSNEYDGNDGLRRVGRLIRKKTVYLDKGNPLDFGKWNRFNLDLSEYFKAEQGAIYRVEVSFRKIHSVYPCSDAEVEDIQMDETDWDEYDNGKSENWDYYGDWNSDYYDYDWWFEGYSWKKESDPCSYSYYSGKTVAKNIFASDIGIITKRGTNGENLIVVTDLITAKPVQGALVAIYDFQQQEIANATTDKDGIVKTKASNATPFFVIAKHNGQKGYLRLGNGNSLSLSHFDVDGAITQEGLKGYIYGERGVWRPGDTLFLNFILEDRDKLLPQNHPVIFELFNARGQLVKRDVQNTSLNGFFNFNSTTTADAPTGNWLAKVSVGGATFTKNIKVETIKPNRLKINLELKDKLISGANPNIEGNLTVNWLHGAPAKQLKTDVSVKLVSTKTVFKEYKDYNFDNPSKSFNFEDEQLFSKNLNEDGKLSFRERLEVDEQAPGMLKAIFTTRAYERGGDFSIDQIAVNYAPYSHFAGIKSPSSNAYGALETDKEYKFPIVTVDKEGKRAGGRKVNVKVYRIEWSWWWQSSEDNIANYINNYDVSPVKKQSITSNANGDATFSLDIEQNDWGRYLILVEDEKSKHSTGLSTYFDWPSWMSRAGRDNPDGANVLSFAADKKEYNTGEKATISFPSSKNSHALISIESGSKVLDAFWIKTDDGETKFTLPITPDLAPNCYVHITLLQPHNQTLNDAPIRLYGVTNISVKDQSTILEPIIKMPAELAPNSTYTISVLEKNKKDMTYTIAVVDEGLLDLTRFKTPNPWNHFYAREALGVKTWDLFDHVIGAYGAKIENILTIGGDESINPGEDTPIRFKPMVRFIGPFTVKGGKTASHKIDVPNYIGSVRTMVIAGQNGAYGSAEETTPVKKPLMILSTLPRVLGPKEKVQLPVNVFAMDKKVKNVSIQVKTNSFVKVIGSSTQEISFSREGDQLVTFDLEVGSLSGNAKVEIIATSGSEKATEIIELEVRQPNLSTSNFNDATIDGKDSWNTSIELHGMENSNSAKLELSTIPPINLEKRLSYLIQYPHGCIEQKTSGAFPQLFLAALIDIDAKTKARIDNNVRSVINKIQRHQLSDGGLSFWEGGTTADDWGTTYAGHFMLEAEKKGYALPFGIKEKWITYQKERARYWSDKSSSISSELAQAYRLYTLALANEPVLSAMNKLRSQQNLSIQASWRLAAAYQIIGKKDVAKEIVQNKTTSIKPYTELDFSYGNDTRDKAMIIETLTLMGEKSKAAVLVKELSEALSKDQWMSTQTTAYSLMAIAQFTENNKPKGGINATYVYNGKKLSISSVRAIELIDLPVNANQKSAEVNITNNSEGILFARVIATGVPLAGDEKEFSNNLGLSVIYKDLSGNKIDVNQIQQGTDFMVEVTVSNPGNRGHYQGLSLSQIFPSGWEIHNQRMDIAYDGSNANNIEYQDIRDDRVYSYFNLNKNQSKTITTRLHAAYIGEYYLPAVYIEAMYDASISAQVKGKKINVVK